MPDLYNVDISLNKRAIASAQVYAQNASDAVRQTTNTLKFDVRKAVINTKGTHMSDEQASEQEMTTPVADEPKAE